MRWEETVMPKYRLCGARITRGANFKLLTLGMLLVLIGAVLIATDQFKGPEYRRCKGCNRHDT